MKIMETKTFAFAIVAILLLQINIADFKPVPDLEVPGGCVHSEQKARYVRMPFEPSSKSDTEGEGNLNPDFNAKAQNREMETVPQIKHNSADKQDLSVGDVKLIQEHALSSDEQLECYRQQNIDPSDVPLDSSKSILKIKDQRPFAYVGQSKEIMMSRPLYYKDRGSKQLSGKEDDDQEITSLYSSPERKSQMKKQKERETKTKDESEIAEVMNQGSVLKPIGVRPEFPVYDEDIDFHPDPLQGILEDKYWLDPQQQEAVIRKYIDLANNVQPPRLDSKMKRKAHREYEPKSVDSKEGFREADALDTQCPCREISACADCSRGKWKKKNNFSDPNAARIANGKYATRKILSIDYESNEDSEDLSSREPGGIFSGADSKDDTLEGKDDESDKDPLDAYQMSDRFEGESQVEGEMPSFTSNFFGRKLLSFDDDQDTNEDYGEDGESVENEYTAQEAEQKEQSPQKTVRREYTKDQKENVAKTNNRRSIDNVMSIIEDKESNEKFYKDPMVFKPSNSGVYAYKLEEENIGQHSKEKVNLAEDFVHINKPVFNHPHNTVKYYVPDRLGNFLQKLSFGNQRRKSQETTTLDPDLEFELVRNKTLYNVSLAMNDINISVTPADTFESVKKRREQPVFSGGKGRRSYQFPHMKHSQIKTLQAADVLVNGTAPNGNNSASNLTDSANATTASLNSPNGNGTTDSSTETPLIVNTTTTPTITTENTTFTKKKTEDYDEDSFDAEIANDIVETVIAESQSGSVVGHNLGLCRRNESISKYARVSPESEMLLKKVTQCILDRIRDRLEGQSCTLLDDELLQFLKWMVLSGESYKDYLARITPELGAFKVEVHDEGNLVSQSTI